jgi:hypothetical protein
MSNQVYLNNQFPMFLSSQGVTAVHMNDNSSPPLAYTGKEILYALDHELYYNGNLVGVAGSNTADFLATTGDSVNVSDSDPPTAGQILIADDATHSTWQDPVFDDTKFFIVDAGDPTNRIAFDADGTGETTTLIKCNATFDRELMLPNATTNLVGCSTNPTAGQIAYFNSTSPSSILPSNITVSGNNLTVPGQIELTGGIITSSTNPIFRFKANDSLFIGLGSGNDTVPGVNQNTACGRDSLLNASVTCSNCSAFGVNALKACTTATQMIAVGGGALASATTPQSCVAVGVSSQSNNVNASFNTSTGDFSMRLLTGGSGSNCAYGKGSLEFLLTGQLNNAFGYLSGRNYTSTESQNLVIDNEGVTGESAVVRIGTLQTKFYCPNSIFGRTSVLNDAIPVLCSSEGQLCTISSAKRFKENIKNLDNTDVIFKFKPVEFDYINQSDRSRKSVGLIAEDVEKEDPDFCIYQTKIIKEEVEVDIDDDDEIFELEDDNEDNKKPKKRIEIVEKKEKELLTVDYNRLNIYMLAEMQKLFNKVQSLEKELDQLKKKPLDDKIMEVEQLKDNKEPVNIKTNNNSVSVSLS